METHSAFRPSISEELPIRFTTRLSGESQYSHISERPLKDLGITFLIAQIPKGGILVGEFQGKTLDEIDAGGGRDFDEYIRTVRELNTNGTRVPDLDSLNALLETRTTELRTALSTQVE